MIDYNSESIKSWSRMGMRKAFGHIMAEVVEERDNSIVISADTASSADLKVFAERFPKKFYDVGITEQNMTAMAAGLALEGNNVFIVTFAPFLSLRAFEAIRTLIGYMNLSVKVIGLGSGLSLGVQGNTHYGLEDISLFRTIPNMRILSPADCYEEAKCIEYFCANRGPAYLRLTGINGLSNVYKDETGFVPEQDTVLREGHDIVIFATGSVVSECMRVARFLGNKGISTSLVNIHSIKPLDIQMVKKMANNHKMMFSVEEGFVSGGLGSAISEVLCNSEHPPLHILGINDYFPIPGDYAFMLDQCGISANKIREFILDAYSGFIK